MNITVKRTWTILRIAILAFLIVGVVNILLIAGWRFFQATQRKTNITGLSEPINEKLRKPSLLDSRYEVLATDPALPIETINYKRLHLDVEPSRVTASYDVYLPKYHPLFFRAERDLRPKRAEALVNEVLGAVSVANERLQFERVETAMADTDERAHLLVSAASHSPISNAYTIKVHAKQLGLGLNIASKEVIVHTRGVNVRTDWHYLPASKSPEETRYVLPATGDELSLLVEVTDDAAIKAETRDTLAAMLQKNLDPPGLSQLLYGLLEALPFIIFLVWCGRNVTALPGAVSQLRVVKTYLVIHFSYFFFYSLSFLIEDWRSPFVSALNYFERSTLAVFSATDYSRHSAVLLPMMALFIYVWPSLVRRWIEPKKRKLEKRKIHSLLRKTRPLLAVLILLGLLALVGWLLIEKTTTMRTDFGLLTVAGFYAVYFAVLILALYVLILLLVQALNLRGRMGFALNLFLVLLLVIADSLFYSFAEGSENKYLRLANGILSSLVFVINAIAIAWVFAVLSYRAVWRRSLSQDFREWNAKKRTLLILALLAVALITQDWTWPMEPWPLWSLAWQLKDLFLLIVVWFLAKYLHQASKEYHWLELPPLARQAGILLALFLFYSPLNRWNYIPVSFIIGYLLLRFWLLPQQQFDRSVFSDIKSNLKGLIERVIDFNDADRAFHSLKKELLTKLGQGELEPQEYSGKLRAQAEALEAHREKLVVHNRFAKDYVLALGPGDSAWDNGFRTARYSLFFSIPWTILYYRDIVRAPATSESYLVLEIVSSAIYFLLAWVSYGFIFGYFYPHIRGKNGIQKALAMFLTIVVPELVWTALAHPVDVANWSSFSFWTLQIFVHTMLLGMIAGDLFIMQSQGFQWRHLLDFYRVSSLSAWASSVILAIAAAAGTLITSGATEILGLAFKYVGVIPPDAELPTK